MRVSPETIYRSLFLQARGVLDKQLMTHLRRVRTMRSSRNASTDFHGCLCNESLHYEGHNLDE